MSSEALTLADETRNGRRQVSPSHLWAAAKGDRDLYGHAMIHAGYIVPKALGKPAETCSVCGCSLVIGTSDE